MEYTGPTSEYQDAQKWVDHIIHPCSGEGGDIREFYLREGRNMLSTFKDPEAKALLTSIISAYSR